MKKIIALLMIVMVVSCEEKEEGFSCNQVFDDNGEYWTCEQLLDTTGLKLYQFSKEEYEHWVPSLGLEPLQVPEDVLHRMSTKSLFYQTILDPYFSLWMATENAIETVMSKLNVCSEFLSRPDAGHVIVEILQKIDPRIIERECYGYCLDLQILAGRPEIIRHMSDHDICNYLHQQLRISDAWMKLNEYDTYEWRLQAQYLLLGLGNVMIRYEYEPFLQTIRDPATKRLVWWRRSTGPQVIDYVKQFMNQ